MNTNTASYSDMPELYEKADIVVYPTVGEEPYGLVPIEAMSCGRPVIASDSGGIRETVVDGTTGFIVPKKDPNALADRLMTLIADPRMARRIGRSGRQRAEKIFSAERYVSDLMKRFGI